MATIHREGGAFRLAADELAKELISAGFVAFVSTRTRQRALASSIERLVEGRISVVGAETASPNACMCVIDVDRYPYRDVLAMMTAADEKYESEQFPSD